MRDEGHVEEEVHGTIRQTPRGYRALPGDPPRYAYRSYATLKGSFGGYFTSTMNMALVSTFAVSKLDFATQLDHYPDAGLGRSAGLESMHWFGLS
jgi:hypothetical protein